MTKHQTYAHSLALARMEGGCCPECGYRTDRHDGWGGPNGCSLTDNGVAARLHQYRTDQQEKRDSMNTAVPPKMREIRIQELKPGMKVARVNVDLEFAYAEVESVSPIRRMVGRIARIHAYQVRLKDWKPGTHQDSCMRPFLVRPTQKIAVVDEEA